MEILFNAERNIFILISISTFFSFVENVIRVNINILYYHLLKDLHSTIYEITENFLFEIILNDVYSNDTI